MGGYLRTALLLAGLTALFVGVGFMIGGQRGMVVAFLLACGMNLFAWWNSDRVVLGMHNAQPIGPGDAPRLFAMTERLAVRAGIPMPAHYMIHEDQPNAFATGRSPDRAAVAVNTGLLDTMSEREVAGVIAPELTHIRNRDTLIMTMTATIAGAIGMLAQFGFLFGGRDSEKAEPLRPDRRNPAGDPRPDRRNDRADGDQPLPRIRGRPHRRRAHRRPARPRLRAGAPRGLQEGP